MSFLIVEFHGKDCAVVPESWYARGKCRWPSCTSDKQLQELISSSAALEPDWEEHDGLVLKVYGKFTFLWYANSDLNDLENIDAVVYK